MWDSHSRAAHTSVDLPGEKIKGDMGSSPSAVAAAVCPCAQWCGCASAQPLPCDTKWDSQSGISWLMEGTGLTPCFSLSPFLPTVAPMQSCSLAQTIAWMGRGKNKHQRSWSSTSFCKTIFLLFSKTTALNLALLALNSGDPSLFLFCQTVLA